MLLEPDRERELTRWLDHAAETIAAAWQALGYRSSDLPGMTLAEAIANKLSALDKMSASQ